jgi:uroporphyrin-III C-methyltransferase
VTGHARSGGEPDLDWDALATANHTVVVYMGLSTAGLIAERLIAAGRAPSTPAAIVENASQPGQRHTVTTLAELAQAAADFDGPAILIIGETAALATSGAYPGESRDPAHTAETGADLAASLARLTGPYDLGPGKRRDKRMKGGRS